MIEGEVFTTELAGREFKVETNSVAKQANGAALVRYGDTVVLVTATCSSQPREGIDFMPLTVDYEERMYSVGKIPGGFIKREGRPSEKAVLSARLIDRPLRPLFPDGFRRDVHVVATVMSVDQDNTPYVAALNGASVALNMSDVPFQEPVGAVQVGLVEGEIVVNPTLEQRENSKLDLMVAGTRNAITMVEAEAREVPEETMLEALGRAHEAIQHLLDFQEQVVGAVGKEKIEPEPPEKDQELEAAVRELVAPLVSEAVVHPDKKTREAQTEDLEERVLAEFLEDYPEQEKEIRKLVQGMIKEEVRRQILEESRRPDTRALDEIRPINCETGYLPRVHGSGLFQRGQTQVLTALTLGAVSDEQILDGLDPEESKRFMHHYNFPPYCVGEARPIRAPSRREVGHGALVERALESMIPSEEDFPYTIRLISEVLESNGSSSMASVCAGSLALMDGGVPIERPVAGIAMGLITDENNYRILTDIQGVEDALGDMDFKVAGTSEGICALQLDSKIGGLSESVLREALEQARAARFHVLDCMTSVLASARPELSPYAPRIIIHQIDPEKIRDVIGPGGKIIRSIIEETGVKIDIEDDGKVFIASADEKAANEALEKVRTLTQDVEVGAVYSGKVTRLMNFGAFVEFLPGKEGLVHISQLAPQRVEKVEDVVSVGDEVQVKVTEIDPQGRINLSRKQALPPEEQALEERGSQGRGHGNKGGEGRPPRKGPPGDKGKQGGPPRRKPEKK